MDPSSEGKVVDDNLPEATEEELRALDIEPDRGLFASVPRVAGHPFVIRVGDSRVERLWGGEVQLSLGYFSPEQTLRRRAWADRMSRDAMNHTSSFRTTSSSDPIKATFQAMEAELADMREERRRCIAEMMEGITKLPDYVPYFAHFMSGPNPLILIKRPRGWSMMEFRARVRNAYRVLKGEAVLIDA